MARPKRRHAGGNGEEQFIDDLAIAAGCAVATVATTIYPARGREEVPVQQQQQQQHCVSSFCSVLQSDNKTLQELLLAEDDNDDDEDGDSGKNSNGRRLALLS
jgi:hypothetical protein